MERYGNIRFTRRVVAFVCMLVVAVSVLMPRQIVKADSTHVLEQYIYDGFENKVSFYKHLAEINGDYKLIWVRASIDVDSGSSVVYETRDYMYLIASKDSVTCKGQFFSYNLCSDNSAYIARAPMRPMTYSEYLAQNKNGLLVYENGSLVKPSSFYEFVNVDSEDSLNKKIIDMYKKGEISDNIGFQATDKAYSEIGCLNNVQMETYVTNKKELIDADENADLSKINQDKVIVYSSTSTTGIDLSKGGYKVQLYGSYAWQDKSGNIKSEDKGHKTFIKDWNAQNNIKGLDRSKYEWIDWKSANDKVEADKTANAHKPNAFEKMTTYANYQYEPIWYLRIVSLDNKYGAWIKLYNSTNKGKYRSESVDDNDNSVSDSDGGYSKPKDTSEITGTGDTPEDAKNNVQKTEEKQDNKDIQDTSGGSNSTFDKLEEFTKGIGDVPKMIADIFSFLPSWCLEVVAIGFALLMILIVVKFIRG